MFGISMQQASTKGMLHYLEHSSNCAIIFVYVYYNLYIMIYIYTYILCTYIQEDVLYCLPVHVFTASQVTVASTPFQRLASTVEAFWRLHQLEDVARRYEPKDGEGREVVMSLLARIEI